jgi:hypothetical protein
MPAVYTADPALVFPRRGVDPRPMPLLRPRETGISWRWFDCRGEWRWKSQGRNLARSSGRTPLGGGWCSRALARCRLRAGLFQSRAIVGWI